MERTMRRQPCFPGASRRAPAITAGDSVDTHNGQEGHEAAIARPKGAAKSKFRDPLTSDHNQQVGRVRHCLAEWQVLRVVSPRSRLWRSLRPQNFSYLYGLANYSIDSGFECEAIRIEAHCQRDIRLHSSGLQRSHALRRDCRQHRPMWSSHIGASDPPCQFSLSMGWEGRLRRHGQVA